MQKRPFGRRRIVSTRKGRTNRPNYGPTFDPVSALAEGLVEWQSV